MSIVEFEFTRDTWLDRAKTPPRRTTTYLIEIPRRSTPCEHLLSSVKSRSTNNFPSLTVYFLVETIGRGRAHSTPATTRHSTRKNNRFAQQSRERQLSHFPSFFFAFQRILFHCSTLPSSFPRILIAKPSFAPLRPPLDIRPHRRLFPRVSGDSVNRKREKDENEKNEDLAPGGSSSTVRVTPNLLHYRPPPGSDVSGFRPCQGTWQHGSKQQHFRSEGD